jgi:hypothetical protein
MLVLSSSQFDPERTSRIRVQVCRLLFLSA